MVVESAVRAWRHKYPTSKVDDCAVVCLYLDAKPFISAQERNNAGPSPIEDVTVQLTGEVSTTDQSDTTQNITITHTPDQSEKSNQPKKVRRDGREGRPSFAERIASEDWSALDGLTRVNSLLSLPRFLMGGRMVR